MPTYKTASTILAHARDDIVANGLWCKGDMVEARWADEWSMLPPVKVEACALGAVRVAARHGGDALEAYDIGDVWQSGRGVEVEATGHLADAIRILHPRILKAIAVEDQTTVAGLKDEDTITMFNDRKQTTRKQVVACFDLAVKLAKRQAAADRKRKSREAARRALVAA
jgi:hypothetical protein